jgi:hypothetical protein
MKTKHRHLLLVVSVFFFNLKLINLNKKINIFYILEIEAHYQTSDNLDDEFDDDDLDSSSYKKRKLSRSSMSIGDEYEDDYDDIDESDNDNDVETDDAYDYLSSSDNNAKIEYINNLKRQKRFTRKRNKYTNESTDSISSDLTVENYNSEKRMY